MTGTSSKDEVQKQILSSQGIPFPARITRRDRCILIWRKIRLAVVVITVFVAGAAAFITNIQKIQNYFKPAPSVPLIVVEVANGSTKPIEGVSRGDFFLWLPGPGIRHTIGKFELRKLDGTVMDSETFTVAPSAKVRLLAKLLNQDIYGRVLQQGDCDIAFMIQRAAGGHKTTNNMPFTKAAIAKYFMAVDIGAE